MKLPKKYLRLLELFKEAYAQWKWERYQDWMVLEYVRFMDRSKLSLKDYDQMSGAIPTITLNEWEGRFSKMTREEKDKMYLKLPEDFEEQIEKYLKSHQTTTT